MKSTEFVWLSFLSAARRNIYMPETESRLIKRRKFRNRSRWFVFIIAAVTVLFTVYPTLGGQVVSNGTEMRYSLLRIESICEGWSNGYFPVRVNPLFFDNYGYGASLTSPDLFLWIPAFLRRLGLGLTDAYNLFICLCVTLCWCTTYKAGKDITKSRYGGLIAAATVVLSQYYANTLFYRASYEDYLSFIFVPVAVLGLYDIFYREYKKPWIYFLGMLGLCCVLRLCSRFQKETEIFACAAAFVCSDSGFDLFFLAAVS